jgi:hypothetical protein
MAKAKLDSPVLKTRMMNGVECVNTGDMCDYLGMIINRDFITDVLKVPPYARVGIAAVWTIGQFEEVCIALQTHSKSKSYKAVHEGGRQQMK